MAKQESHIRSLIKGISWRIIATTDTILVVLFITCLYGQCSIGNALKIGLIEFFIKYVIYYFHERIWEKFKKGGTVTKRHSLYKSISWRILATTTTFIISGTILKSFNEIALFIALTELITKFALYYLHERLWLRIPVGKIRSYFKKQ